MNALCYLITLFWEAHSQAPPFVRSWVGSGDEVNILGDCIVSKIIVYKNASFPASDTVTLASWLLSELLSSNCSCKGLGQALDQVIRVLLEWRLGQPCLWPQVRGQVAVGLLDGRKCGLGWRGSGRGRQV